MFLMKIRYIIISLCISGFSFSQENFESIGETALSVNHKVSSTYRVNFSARTRYFLYRDSELNIENRQIDLVHFSTYNLDYNHSLSFGLQYRFREGFDGGSNEVRLTQQFNYTKQNLALRFGHRVRLEQRILDELTIIRSRYRFAVDFPLNGEKIDVGEAYLVTSMEMLLSLSHNIKPEFDHRTTGQLGWKIAEHLKLQAGLEYRFEALNLNTEHLLFILTTAVLKL